MRQKHKRSNSCRKTASSQNISGISSHISDSSLNRGSDVIPTSPSTSHDVSTPSSPLLFSDPVNCDTETSQVTSHPNISHEPSYDSDMQTTTIGDIDTIGDRDTDLIEMELYDLYRQEDGEGYSHQYLQKCGEKLIRKVRQYRIKINQLQTSNMELKLESEREKERI